MIATEKNHFSFFDLRAKLIITIAVIYIFILSLFGYLLLNRMFSALSYTYLLVIGSAIEGISLVLIDYFSKRRSKMSLHSPT
jgi:hypothetical protein